MLATLLYGVVAASGQVLAQADPPVEAAHVFTLPAGWSFVGSPVAIRKPAPGTDHQLPTDGFVAVIERTPDSHTGDASSAAEEVGVAGIRFGPNGAGRIAWTMWLGDASTDVRIGGGRDVTGDGDSDVLVCVSPREEYHFVDGKLLVLSASDGAIQSTTSVATRGLLLGSGISSIGEAPTGSSRFLITAALGEAPAKLIDFDMASGVARVAPLVVQGASMVYDGLAWLGPQDGRGDPVIALRILDEYVDRNYLPDSRVVAIDLGTHEQRTLYKGNFDAQMCRAVAVGDRWTDDVMIAVICEVVLPSECLWLELRRVSSRTGKILSTSKIPLDDEREAELMASSFGVPIDAWDDLDGDGTRDYVCHIGGTCPPDVWRLLLVSGATGALLGRIDDAMLARQLGPDAARGIDPWFALPLLMAPGSTPAIAIGLGRQDLDSGSSSVAVLDLRECLRTR